MLPMFYLFLCRFVALQFIGDDDPEYMGKQARSTLNQLDYAAFGLT
jgi:hypothetical protein